MNILPDFQKRFMFWETLGLQSGNQQRRVEEEISYGILRSGSTVGGAWKKHIGF
jgi:hypothetical protein